MTESRAPEADPRASVLIVAYRTPELIDDCLKSLYAGVTDEVEVVVVDNASGDGTAEQIAANWPQVKLIVSDTNLGFARAVNLAARHATGEVLVLLNPDTVVHDDPVAELVSFLRERPEVGLAGGRTLAPDGTLDPRSCWGRPTVWSTFCFAAGLSTAFKGNRFLDPEALGGWQRDDVRQVGVVTGCLLAVPRTVWDELGGFDPSFFMYGEDVDLSLRAAALGYQPSIDPKAVITHVVGASSAHRADKMMLVMKGKATVADKHLHPAAKALLAAGVAVRAAGARATRNSKVVWPELWRRRREWLAGYPRVEETPDPVTRPSS